MVADAPAAAELQHGAAGAPRTRRSALGRLLRDRVAVTGIVIVALFALAAIAAPLLAPHDPARVAALDKLQGPSALHPLGTDHLGRDVLSRLLFGARWSMGTAALAAGLVMTIGIGVGAVAGYFGGKLDTVISGVIDVLLGLPSLVLALAIVGMLGPGIVNVMIGLVAVWWVDYARIVRGMVLSLREREFVQAARALGASDRHVLVRHVLPNVVPVVAVLASLEIGTLILAISSFSFIGIGVQPPTPEWGAMLNEGRVYFLAAPQLMLYPGVAISVVVLGWNLLGDGLRDVLDTRVTG